MDSVQELAKCKDKNIFLTHCTASKIVFDNVIGLEDGYGSCGHLGTIGFQFYSWTPFKNLQNVRKRVYFARSRTESMNVLMILLVQKIGMTLAVLLAVFSFSFIR
mgnify:FL=1